MRQGGVGVEPTAFASVEVAFASSATRSAEGMKL